MGLDMYLSAKLYTSDFLYRDARDALAKVELPGVTKPYRDEGAMDTVQLELPVMYWRKANVIHAWFVREVQEGTDDCRTAYVDPDKLRELRDLCRELLKDVTNTAAVKEKLPPTSGFFFGPTDIDEWFWQDVENTADTLDAVLAQVDAGELKGWDFYYHSSW